MNGKENKKLNEKKERHYSRNNKKKGKKNF